MRLRGKGNNTPPTFPTTIVTVATQLQGLKENDMKHMINKYVHICLLFVFCNICASTQNANLPMNYFDDIQRKGEFEISMNYGFIDNPIFFGHEEFHFVDSGYTLTKEISSNLSSLKVNYGFADFFTLSLQAFLFPRVLIIERVYVDSSYIDLYSDRMFCDFNIDLIFSYNERLYSIIRIFPFLFHLEDIPGHILLEGLNLGWKIINNNNILVNLETEIGLLIAGFFSISPTVSYTVDRYSASVYYKYFTNYLSIGSDYRESNPREFLGATLSIGINKHFGVSIGYLYVEYDNCVFSSHFTASANWAM